MSDGSRRYADWKAPADDGGLLIWPEPRDLLLQARRNHSDLTDARHVRIQNAPLADLRAAARRWLGHSQPEQLILATGHQAELYHPGVWAKDVLINAAADRLGASAIHFAVDTDHPKHLYLQWPGGSEPITDDPELKTAAWTGLLRAPTPAHVESLGAKLDAARAGWKFEPLAGAFLRSLRRMGVESQNLAWTITNGCQELDWTLGLRHASVLTSPLWESAGYLALVHHILSRADHFAADYNAALGEFRREQGIRKPGRPWPDLRVRSGECEAPVWCEWPAQGRRSRAMVARVDDRWVLRAAEGEFAFDPRISAEDAASGLAKFLRASGLVLPPRALALTLFVRLFLADLFVHGIGGGKYDQVTDRVIARHFSCEPPGFAVATATLFFPDAARRQRIDLRPMLQEGRRIRHGAFSSEKMRLVREIEAAPRNSERRRHLFRQMHAKLAEAMRRPPFVDWERQFEQAQRLAAEQAVIFDRELFYAIQPADRLGRVIEQFRARF